MELPCEEDEISDHHIGHLISKHARRIRHTNAHLGCRAEVDVVDADPPLGDDAEAIRVCEDRRGQRVVADDDAIGAGQQDHQLLLAQLLDDAGQHDIDPVSLQPGPMLVDSPLQLGAGDQDAGSTHAEVRRSYRYSTTAKSNSSSMSQASSRGSSKRNGRSPMRFPCRSMLARLNR